MLEIFLDLTATELAEQFTSGTNEDTESLVGEPANISNNLDECLSSSLDLPVANWK